MRLINTIRLLFRGRRAAGGEVRPRPVADDEVRIQLSPGGRCDW